MSINQRHKTSGDIYRVRVLNDVAVEYFEMGLQELSYKIWSQIYQELLEQKADLRVERILPVVSCNMGNVLRRRGEYERAYQVCRRGLQWCFGTGAIDAAPELSFQLATLCLRFGDKEQAGSMYFLGRQCLRWGRQTDWPQPIEAFMDQDFVLCCQSDLTGCASQK